MHLQGPFRIWICKGLIFDQFQVPDQEEIIHSQLQVGAKAALFVSSWKCQKWRVWCMEQCCYSLTKEEGIGQGQSPNGLLWFPTGREGINIAQGSCMELQVEHPRTVIPCHCWCQWVSADDPWGIFLKIYDGDWMEIVLQRCILHSLEHTSLQALTMSYAMMWWKMSDLCNKCTSTLWWPNHMAESRRELSQLTEIQVLVQECSPMSRKHGIRHVWPGLSHHLGWQSWSGASCVAPL